MGHIYLPWGGTSVSKNENAFNSILNILGCDIGRLFKNMPSDLKNEMQEIRLRSGKPVTVVLKNKIYFLNCMGELVQKIDGNELISSKNLINNIFQSICSYSVYSHQEEIKNGFITINGGHRIGICGSAVTSSGNILSVKDISSINIRIARQKTDISKVLFDMGVPWDMGVLIVGPPSSGKTTILRDIARNLSLGRYSDIKKVVVVDERGELACVSNGESLNDIGLCDVLDGYPKGEGIMQALRSMSPDIIVCDEIGNIGDIEAIEEGLNAGVSIISTIHARSIDELLKRKQAIRLLDTRAFSNIVMLKDRSKPGEVEKIYGVDEIYAQNNRINNINFCRDYGRICGVS